MQMYNKKQIMQLKSEEINALLILFVRSVQSVGVCQNRKALSFCT